MVKKNLKYLFFFFLFLIPSAVLANDLEITCYSDQAPVIIRNTDPLFQLTNFLPGDSASRTVFVKNTDTVNDCKIFFDVSGSTNVLTDKVNVHIPGLFDDTLSEYITGSRILMADLVSNAEITRTITMELPSNAGNSYTDKKASFDISVQSEWGFEQTGTAGEVAGISDKKENGEVLGIAITTEDGLLSKTGQAILSIFLFSTFLLLSYLLHKRRKL